MGGEGRKTVWGWSEGSGITGVLSTNRNIVNELVQLLTGRPCQLQMRTLRYVSFERPLNTSWNILLLRSLCLGQPLQNILSSLFGSILFFSCFCDRILILVFWINEDCCLWMQDNFTFKISNKTLRKAKSSRGRKCPRVVKGQNENYYQKRINQNS